MEWEIKQRRYDNSSYVTCVDNSSTTLLYDVGKVTITAKLLTVKISSNNHVSTTLPLYYRATEKISSTHYSAYSDYWSTYAICLQKIKYKRYKRLNNVFHILFCLVTCIEIFLGFASWWGY